VRCLHVPLRSKCALAKKVAHGQALKAFGYPRWHGWQSQMLVGELTSGLVEIAAEDPAKLGTRTA
jgi:hypothetical protein